jgi:pectate lyase
LALFDATSAQKVVGKAEESVTGVTGGGNASPVYPEDITELKAYLTDKNPRVIVLNKVFDELTSSEDAETGTACASWGTGSSCQKIIQGSCGSSPAIKST